MEKIQELYKKALEWWNKFNPRQKTLIISVVAGVILVFSILAAVLTRPKYVSLRVCETTKEASEVVDLLKGESYDYKISTDGLRISINEKQQSDAALLLGANNITTDAFTIDNVLSGGLSTTESDKQKRYLVLLESDMEKTLERNEFVDKADVTLTIPNNDGTLIARDEESSAAVVLQLNGELPGDSALALATFIKTALGNKTTDSISIIDTNGNLLFSGEDNITSTGNASTQLTVKQQAENLVRGEVRSVLIGTTLYDSVEVSSNLSIDFSSEKTTTHDFTPADGQTQGVLSNERVYESETTGTSGGEPGTGSNDSDKSTYVMSDYDNSSSTVSERESNYLPNEEIINKETPPGKIIYAESSIAVAATKLRVYKQEEIDEQGLLAGTTWEEYKAANSENLQLEVTEEMYSVVANATGIPQDKITIVAYEKPVFIDKQGLQVDIWDIITVILIIVIVGLLAVVVLRSMRAEVVETEEELSVEALLQSTPELELDNIEVEEKSETRRMIEKFVEENPEAVASLLRNWLTEDWG